MPGKKNNGGHRLVTFSDVGLYSKPQPSLMPNVDSTLRNITQWKFIICTDLTSALYEIPLDKDSVKYCGVVMPFRGVRSYVWSTMGMPGSETALEELMCHALGDLLTEGVVTKLADEQLDTGPPGPGPLWLKVVTIQNYYMSWDGHYSGMEMQCRHTICDTSQGLCTSVMSIA